jgi:hypothetical protein
MYVGQKVRLRDLHKMPLLPLLLLQQQNASRDNGHHTYATICIRFYVLLSFDV